MHACSTRASLVMVFALAACSARDTRSDARADSAAMAKAAPAPSAPNVVTIVSSDYKFEAPDTIRAGLTTFNLSNQGPSLHHVQMFSLDSGKTPDDFVAALKKGGPPPTWAAPAGGPNPSEIGRTTSTTLEMKPGSYVMLCFIPDSLGRPHVMLGMMKGLTVSGAAPANVTEPAADVVLTLTDYDFAFSKPLTAGTHTLRVENSGPQPHEVALIELKPGKTIADFEKWSDKTKGAAPGIVHGGVSAIMPGAHAFFVAKDLPAGSYALICFVPDHKDGKPHFAHGMAKAITIS